MFKTMKTIKEKDDFPQGKAQLKYSKEIISVVLFTKTTVLDVFTYTGQNN